MTPMFPRAARLALLLLIVLLSACSGRGGRGEETERLPVDELYREAKLAMDNGNFDKAARYFQRLQARFPFGEISEQAQLDLAYSQYRNRKPDESIATANRFIKTYPTHPNVDYAYYLKGLVNFDRDRGFVERYLPIEGFERDQAFGRQAFIDFGELIKRFPNSRYAADARQRMTFLRESLAAYEMTVAKYYFRRGAFVGAANRAKYVVENFQQTPQTADALALLVESYRALGKNELAQDAESVLKLNFPNHPLLTGRNADREAWYQKLWPFGRKKPESAS
jgi:outer membrane protein assembly factor BamD